MASGADFTVFLRDSMAEKRFACGARTPQRSPAARGLRFMLATLALLCTMDMDMDAAVAETRVATEASAGAAAAAVSAAGETTSCEASTSPAAGGRVCIAAARFERDVCSAISALAKRHALPEGLFARLIWQESRFDAKAVSPKGAEGIAQFMPETARLRGLADSFNPADALEKSAAYIREMTERYGNVGLALVGYNAGEQRAADLLARARPVPFETEGYVLAITGFPVEAWRAGTPREADLDFSLDPGRPFLEACLALATRRTLSRMAADDAPTKPWGVQIGAGFSEATARRIFASAKTRFGPLLEGESPLLVRERNPSFGRRLRITVRIGRDTAEEARALCRRIAESGGACMVRPTGG